MLNSYKTLINGIATAVNSLKAEIKKLSGKVEDIDLPEIDGQTIIKGADGKLKTAIGGHDYDFEIYWGGCHENVTFGLPFYDVDSNKESVMTYYKASSRTPSAAQLDGAALTWSPDYRGSSEVVTKVKENLTASGIITATSSFFFDAYSISFIIALKDGAEYKGVTIPEKGVYASAMARGAFTRMSKGTLQKIDNELSQVPVVNISSDSKLNDLWDQILTLCGRDSWPLINYEGKFGQITSVENGKINFCVPYTLLDSGVRFHGTKDMALTDTGVETVRENLNPLVVTINKSKQTISLPVHQLRSIAGNPERPILVYDSKSRMLTYSGYTSYNSDAVADDDVRYRMRFYGRYGWDDDEPSILYKMYVDECVDGSVKITSANE